MSGADPIAPSSSSSRAARCRADVLTDAIRRRIVDVCGLLVDDVVLVPSGTVARTTSGKVRRAATKMLYECGDLEAAATTWSDQRDG